MCNLNRFSKSDAIGILFRGRPIVIFIGPISLGIEFNKGISKDSSPKTIAVFSKELFSPFSFDNSSPTYFI